MLKRALNKSIILFIGLTITASPMMAMQLPSPSDKKKLYQQYAILGINSNADARTIKSAYQALALKQHPDRNQNTEAKQKMQELKKAYNILTDRTARSQHLSTCTPPTLESHGTLYEKEYWSFKDDFFFNEYNCKKAEWDFNVNVETGRQNCMLYGRLAFGAFAGYQWYKYCKQLLQEIKGKTGKAKISRADLTWKNFYRYVLGSALLASAVPAHLLIKYARSANPAAMFPRPLPHTPLLIEWKETK